MPTPLTLWQQKAERALLFVEHVARLTKDHECAMCGLAEHENPECSEHELFDMPNDDAVETLHSLISEARALDRADADAEEQESDFETDPANPTASPDYTKRGWCERQLQSVR